MSKLIIINNNKKIVTHNGKFHLDEVMAVAILFMYVHNNKDWEIVRTRDPKIIDDAKKDSATWLLDLGLTYEMWDKNLDHHQNENLPSTQVLVTDYLMRLAEKQGNVEVIEELTFPIRSIANRFSDWDTGKNNIVPRYMEAINKLPEPFSSMVENLAVIVAKFNRDISDAVVQHVQFIEAVKFVMQVLENEVYEYRMEKKADKIWNTRKSLFDGKVVLLDGYIPKWESRAKAADKNIQFAIYPSMGNYKIHSVDSRKYVIPQLDELSNLMGDEYSPEEIVFVHANGFIGATTSESYATKVLSFIVN